MITLASETQTEQEMKDALVANGLTVTEPAKPEEPAAPVEDKTKSEPEGAPGEKIPAETKGEVPATPEVAESKPQETPQEHKPKGGFQAKVEKLTAKADRLMEELEAERGSKTALQRKLDEVNAQLAELKPAEVKTDEGPVRPKRPKLSDVDFDQDKHEENLEKYETELDAYYKQVADDTAKQAVAGYEQSAAQARHQSEWLGRINEDKKDIPGYDELIAMLPDEKTNPIQIPPLIAAYMEHKSKHPGHLSAYLAKDYLDEENPGAEMARLSKLDEYDQVIEIREIEDRLVKEAKAAKKPAKDAEPTATEVKPVAPKSEVVPPVKEKPKAEALDDPISPVGTRAIGRQRTMAELSELAAGGDKAARKMLMEQVTAVQAAKHGVRQA